MDNNNYEHTFINGIFAFNDLLTRAYELPNEAIPQTWYRRMFESMKKIHKDGLEVNYQTLCAKSGHPINEILKYIDPDIPVIKTSWEYCFDAIIERYKNRYIDTVSRRNIEPQEKINLITGFMSKFKRPDSQLVHLGDVAEEKERLEKEGYFKRYCKTGIPQIDENIQINKEDLITIGARPGVGKSALGIQIMAFLSKSNIMDKFIFFNLEMSKFLTEKRFMMHNPKLDILLMNKSSIRLHELRSIIENERPKVICIDQLNKIEPNIAQKTIREAYVIVMKDLKAMCKDYGIVIFLIAQLRRSQTTTNPTISDFKESGSIEEESDIIMLISRTDERMLVDVAKYRNGCTKEIQLLFDGSKQKIYGE